MPSIISAGTTASTGLNLTADTSGNLVFQTNGNTTAMTIDTSQNVTYANGVSFTGVIAGNGANISSMNASNLTSGTVASARLPSITSISNGTSNVAIASSNGNVTVATNGTTAVTVDTSQNLAVGTSSPGGARLQLYISKSNTTTTDMTDNSTLSLANAGTGNGVFNCIKFAANQQDMFISSFNNNTQANRRIGFFVGSVAGNATTDERVSIYGNGNFAFNSGYGSTAVAYGCRAWVNFDGSSGSIRGSGNVTSVSRTGTGQYTLNFTTSMPDTNYSVVGIANADSRTVSIGNLLTGSAAMRTTNSGGALEDQSLVAIAVFR